MPSARSQPSSTLRLVRGGRQPIRLGLLRLTDAAPVVVAAELGFFVDEGLDVQLSVEPSWANIADKLAFGLLHGAVVLPPLALAVHLGLRGAPAPLAVPLSLSLNGNTVTFSSALADEVSPAGAPQDAIAAARRFAALLAARHGKAKPRIAVVHPFSTHHLLLRYWLAAGGVDPDATLAIDVVPPARTAEALREGRIDGFCAGAPWGEVAARAGVGRTITTSAAIWSRHPEKAFAVRARWADEEPVVVAALLRALLRAARFCDQPENAPAVARLLADERYVAIDADAIAGSLPGGKPACSSIFFAHAATFPWRSHAVWFLGQMTRWGYLPAGVDVPAVAAELYRPDIYRAAAADIGVATPLADAKAEGGRADAWRLAATPADIAMGPDLFCDGASFEPAPSRLPAASKESS